MTEKEMLTAGEAAATIPPGLPLYMRRNGFDPAPELGEIRAATGVCAIDNVFGTKAYLVTRYDDIKLVLADHERFSSAKSQGYMPSGVRRDGNILGLDPPEQQRLRRMLTSAFTARRVERLKPRVVDITDQHLDAMEEEGAPIDLVSSFALPIPSLVICELLGVPTADQKTFQWRTARQLDLSVPMTERLELRRQGIEYMGSLVAAARRNPGEDMLGMLVRDHGGELTDPELIGTANLLLEAGHETTANMLGLGTLALLRHPEQLAAVRDHPDAVAPAVEELLRWLSVAHTGFPRITTTDVEVGGVTIPAGELVIVSLSSGNRDDSYLDAPDVLDVGRGAPGHLAFGHGVHHCLGAPLARMEMGIAFPALLRRFPNLALAEDFDTVRFGAFNLVYGPRALQVTW